jgi:hypothetical protein
VNDEERDLLAKDIVKHMRAEEDGLAEDIVKRVREAEGGTPGVLKNAGEAIGLIAGVVGLAYMLGGLVLALRMLLDGYRAEQAVSVIGLLPRESVITLGFVEVVASAALVGVVVAVIAAAVNKPSHLRDEEPLDGSLVVMLFLASAVAALICVLLLAAQDGWRWQLLLEALFGILAFAALCAGWRALRLAGGDLHHRVSRVLLVAFVFTVAAIPLTAGAASLASFERVRLCVTGYDEPRVGHLIALTTDWAVVGRDDESRPLGTRRTVVVLPGESVTRADTGATTGLPPCPTATDSGA